MTNRRILVTGGAGFIGSHIVDRLAGMGNEVTVYDNLSTGSRSFLKRSLNNVRFIHEDLQHRDAVSAAMKNIDIVFHMAANADIKDNLKDPVKCLDQNTMVTSNVLEAMRMNGVKSIAFASSSSVYGEPDIVPTPEDAPFPIQTSIYGASKLACEGLLQAYAVGYDFNVYIFRLVSLMGERYTHGCVFDFYTKLLHDSERLEILGDGKQKKSFLYIQECIDAMFNVIQSTNNRINIYNLGHEDIIEVTPVAKIVCKQLGFKNVRFDYVGGARGWVGDSPFVHLDITKAKSLGWRPAFSIADCVKKTVKWLQDNRWALDRH
jgi:UDP-glucose 4-epimerase